MKLFFRALALIVILGGYIQLSAQCNAGFSFVQPAGSCAASPVQFTATGNPVTITSYFWTFGDGGFNANPTAQHSYPVTAVNTNYTVTLTVTDTSGASCNTSQVVTVLGVTPISATLSQPFFCAPDTSINTFPFSITIDPASMGAGPFTVNFGDGSAPVNSAGPVIPHTYVTYGTFNITITANGASCPGFYTQVYFYTDPVAVPDPVQPFICEGNAITVHNLSDVSKGNIDYFEWDWGIYGPTYIVYDTATQSYTYNLDSINICVGLPFQGYSDGVKLTAYNKCSDHFAITQIKIRALPRAKFDWPKPVCLPNAPVAFINQSCPVSLYVDPISFTWLFENTTGGVDTSYLPSPIYTYTQPGQYDVTLIVTNNCGADTVKHTVDVIPPPVAAFVADTTFGCIDFCISVTNNSTPGSNVNYTWVVFGDTACWDYADTTQNNHSFQPGFCFSCPDSFPIRLTAQNVCGVDSVRDTIFARQPPDLDMAFIGDTCGVFVLNGIFYSVIDYGAPITAYNWTFTGGIPATFNGPVPPPVTFSPGNNSVQLCVVNDCGNTCITRDFFIAPLTGVNAGADMNICLNDTVVLSANPSPGFWSGPSVDSLGVFIPDTFGSYQLIYTHLAASCREYDTVMVTVQDTPTVNVLTPLTQLCLDTSIVITLNAAPAGGTWLGFGLFNNNQFRADTAGTFTFVYEVADPLAGCVGRGFATIIVDTIPRIDSIPAFVLYCYGNFPEPLPGVVPAGGTWTGSAGIQGNQFNPGLLPGPDTLMIYYTFTNSNGCTGTDSMEVRVVNPSSVDAGPADTLCLNAGTGTLPGGFPQGGEWSILSGNYLTDPITGGYNTLQMNSGNNPFTYTIFAGTSCETSDVTNVFIYDTTQVAIGPDTTICTSAGQFFLTASVAGGTWVGLGIVNPTTGLYNPALVPPGTTDQVCYSIINAFSCESRDCRLIYVDSLPTPGFGGPLVGCIGQNLSFPISSVYATSHLWNYGDGTALTNSNSHMYSFPGTFTIIQYAYNANGCVDSTSRTIIISEPPAASFTVDVDSGCAPLMVTFTNTSNIAGGICFWNFGDGQTDNNCSPAPHVFQDSADVAHYTVTLTIANLCDTVTATRVITVFPRPQIIFDSQVDTGCSVLPIQFGNLTTGKPDDFFWYLNTISPAGLFSTDSIPPIQYYSHPGSTGFSVYEIFLLAVNQCGADTGRQEIVVLPNTLDALFNTSDLSGCAPLTVTFADLSGAPFLCWEINGTNPPGDTVSYTFTNPGTYTVKHCVNNGCSYDTNQVVITVYPQPIVAFTADTMTICQGDTIHFTNFSQGTNTQTWNFGDGATSTAFSPSHTYSLAGNYTVTLTAFADTNSCSNQATTVINVLPPPAVSFLPSDTAGCPPLVVNFSNVPPNLNYIWNFGDNSFSTAAQPSHTYSNTGYYIASLTVVNNLGCRNKTSRGIRVHEVPTADFSANADTVCGPGVPVVFQNLSSGDTILAYAWDFGDGSPVSTQINPIHAYSTPGIYTVVLTTSNVFNCEDNASKVIVVLPQPQAILSASDTLGCVPMPVIFTDNSLNSSGREWLIDGQFFTANPVNITFNSPPDTCYQIVLIADTAGFCFDTATFQVCTSSSPQAVFAPDQAEFCGAPATVNFTDQSQSTRPYTVVWSFGDGSSSTAVNPSHTYTAVGEYVVTQTLLTDYGCTSVFTDTIYVYPQPQAILSASDTLGCVPMPVIFTDNSLNSSGREWLIDGQFFATNPVNITFNSPPDTCYQIVLIADTAGFCFDTANFQVCTSSSPQAVFAPDQAEFCGAPATVNFTDQSQSTRPYTVVWSFGDGSSSTAVNPSHTYTAVGEYVVTQTLLTDYGCTSVFTDTIYVYPQPQAILAASDTLGCVPMPVIFTDNSLNSSGREWLIDGQFFTANPVNITFNSPPDTCYQIVLIADTAGFCFDTANFQVCTASPPLADFRTAWDKFCGIPAQNQFTDLSQSTLPLTYQWSFGDGGTSVLKNPSHIYQQTGTFPVRLVVTNSYGCRDTLTDQVVVLPQPDANFLPNPDRGCSPLRVVFANNSSGFSGSLWDFGDGTGFSTQTNPDHIYYPTDTVFTVKLIVDTADFCFDSVTTQIRVGSAPVADFDASLYEACQSATVTFTNRSFSAALGLSYRWHFGNGDSSSLKNPVVFFNQPGSYEVQLVTINTYGCKDTFTQTINIYPQAEASFIADPVDICEGESVFFRDMSVNATRWHWNFGDGAVVVDSMPIHRYDQEGVYDVELIVSFDGKCADTLRYDDLIVVHKSPLASFTAKDTSLIPGRPDGMVVFTNQSLFADRYRWDFGNGDTSNVENPVYQYTINTSYEVMLVAYAANGCTDTAWQTINIGGVKGLQIPNAFAPVSGTQPDKDDPHSGDLFTVFFPRGIGLRSYHIAVYSRWGELLWESTKLSDGVPTEWWDGKDRMGSLMTSGVYIYQVHEAVFEDGSEWPGMRRKSRTGNITLIR
ncbi:MAG: PKD domain-containing protein [Bacteroidia bacterium]